VEQVAPVQPVRAQRCEVEQHAEHRDLGDRQHARGDGLSPRKQQRDKHARNAILCLPILFAAGMSLLDTIDGAFMNFAYGWAFAKPVRKIYYNITITALSVAVALIIGTIELIAVFSDKLSLTGGIWDFVAGIDLNYVGYAIVGVFVATWVIALAVWRFGRIEQRLAGWQAAEGVVQRLDFEVLVASRALGAWQNRRG
jgi:hypothetical protein